MAQCNPCCCWNMKDGCMIIGIWSLIWSIIQLGLFSWQTAVVKYLRDRMENRRIPGFQSYDVFKNRLGGGDWNEIYVTPEEKIYFALFIVQILNLIAAFALLFASVALIYGIHTNSKFLIWPWFPCIGASIICALAYCILWWIGNAHSYWMALTIIEFLAVAINVYCIFCIVVQYRRILKGQVEHKRFNDQKPKQVIYEYKTEGGQNEVFDYDLQEKVPPVDDRVPQLCYLNASYEHEPPPATRVSLFTRNDLQQQTKDNKQYNAEIPEIAYNIEQGHPYNAQYAEPVADEWAGFAEAIEPEKEEPAKDVPPISYGKTSRDYEHKNGGDARSERPKDKTKSSESAKGLTEIESRSRSKGRTSEKYECVSKTTTKSDKSHRSRSESRRHRCKYCHYGDQYESESETKRVSSTDDHDSRSSRHKNGHQHGRDGDGTRGRTSRSSEKKDESACNCRKRSVRDLKRADKTKTALKASSRDKARTRTGSGSTEFGSDSGLEKPKETAGVSSQGFGGGISIPQHIVIPPQSNRNAPQTYQISSEVTISYSDKSAPTSDSERERGGKNRIQNNGNNPKFAPSKDVQHPTAAIQTSKSSGRGTPAVGAAATASSRPTSSESKARGSGTTAI